jgi:hypothetical protein
VYQNTYAIIDLMGKSSNFKKLASLNGLSLLFIVLIVLIDKFYATTGNMAEGIALFPLALIAWAVWLWTYITDFEAIFRWLAKRLGFRVRKGFIILLAIFPLVALILYGR